MEYTNTQMFYLIDDWIHNARDRKILKDRLINGISIEALAEKYDVSVAQMKRIIDKYQKMLFAHLK